MEGTWERSELIVDSDVRKVSSIASLNATRSLSVTH